MIIECFSVSIQETNSDINFKNPLGKIFRMPISHSVSAFIELSFELRTVQ
jgi:hypothetical protein